MMTEERRSQLADRCEKHITWLMTLTPEAMTVCNSVKEQLDIYGIALAALTQHASPALKLPDGWRLMPNEPTEEMMRAMYQAQDMWPSAHCDNMRETQMSFARPRYIAALATAPKAPPAPRTAPIEPIGATGGVKVPQGWSLVPNEATRVMIEEGDQWELSENIWNAMIGVAPKP